MVLGSFHFNRSNDGSDVVANNQIDVTTEVSQQALEGLAQRIVDEFQPTLVVVEFRPQYQSIIDSLYQAYQNGSWELGKNETFQLGFRIASKANLSSVQCVDTRPPQPEAINSIDDFESYADSLHQREAFEEYNEANTAFNAYMDELLDTLTVDQYLQVVNSEAHTQRTRHLWHTGLVNLGQGDSYIGADLTGNWYTRNTRIMVNARSHCRSKQEHVLVIYGSAHKWVLDELFASSPEFTVMQPF